MATEFKPKTLGTAMQAIGRAIANPGTLVSAADDLSAGSAEIFEAAQTLVRQLELKNVKVERVASHIEVVTI